MKRIAFTPLFVLGALAVITAGSALANHAWGNYHWARTQNPFELKLGDNVSSSWDAYLSSASSDWSASSVLDTVVVGGQAGNPAQCLPTQGRVEVCSAKYGNTGWLGIAQIWADGDHITQSRVAMNDTYFHRGTYDTPEWRQFVVCQEVGHAFGLGHQDEDFDNGNLGTCMDYTSDPSTNLHPDSHDFDQLENIYGHTDGFSTVDQSDPDPIDDGGGPGNGKGGGNGKGKKVSVTDRSEWGRLVSGSAGGSGGVAVFERNLGSGEKVLTFVIWAD